ncbi:hypothetical protein [Paenibacillus campi]|uniref:hypothetical protein n=1 Tax=Paenibacillus campi TaxID=3106031 RepID=UPI002AFEA55A|nr:hypothetical protein [Paenibacillus sp. SGZ-1009]
MDGIKRPCWLTIALSVITVFSAFKLVLYTIVFWKAPPIVGSLQEQIAAYITVALIFVGVGMLLVGGILSFIGINVGRWLIVGWGMLALVVYRDYIIARLVFLLIATLLLFNKLTNRFFRAHAHSKKTDYMEEQV